MGNYGSDVYIIPSRWGSSILTLDEYVSRKGATDITSSALAGPAPLKSDMGARLDGICRDHHRRALGPAGRFNRETHVAKTSPRQRWARRRAAHSLLEGPSDTLIYRKYAVFP